MQMDSAVYPNPFYNCDLVLPCPCNPVQFTRAIEVKHLINLLLVRLKLLQKNNITCIPLVFCAKAEHLQKNLWSCYCNSFPFFYKSTRK